MSSNKRAHTRRPWPNWAIAILENAIAASAEAVDLIDAGLDMLERGHELKAARTFVQAQRINLNLCHALRDARASKGKETD